MQIDLKKLAAFLEKANQETYAADGKKAESTRLKSEDFNFKDGDWTYHNTYFGNNNFIGEEIVYKNEIPVWGMNYYGYVVDTKHAPKEVYGFLKKSLMQEYNDLIPVRGPRRFVDGKMEYDNIVSGDLNNFLGEETITNSGNVIYKAVYHGGLLIGND